jgi:hypothetical protein
MMNAQDAACHHLIGQPAPGWAQDALVPWKPNLTMKTTALVQQLNDVYKSISL